MSERTLTGPVANRRPRHWRRVGRSAERQRTSENQSKPEPAVLTKGAGVAEASESKAREEVVPDADLFEPPTEPRHALPTYPDIEGENEWEAPTIPDGQMLDRLEPDERG